MRSPKRYRNEFGQLMRARRTRERDIRRPMELEHARREGDFPLLVKQYDGINELILDHHPFDVVGWDGYFYPWAFNIHDFEPIVGRVHQPPPVHQTFEGDGFVVCSFCPRPYDFDPNAVPAPYNHSNVDSDEVLYYASSEFMSRKGIEFGSHHASSRRHSARAASGARRGVDRREGDERARGDDGQLPAAQGREARRSPSRTRATTGSGSTRSTRSSIRRRRESGSRRSAPMTAPLWTPSAERIARANLTHFGARFLPGAGYAELWRWSVDRPDEFWPAVWDFTGVVAAARSAGPSWDVVLRRGDRMAPPDATGGPRWFPGARLNFAENLLRFDDARPALVCWNELGRQRILSFTDLRREVARFQAALRREGVVAGDRVAGLLPNFPETVIAMLAAASLGAVWSSCSPDFGDRAVLDRFSQIQPTVLFSVDGYRYAGKAIDLAERVERIALELPSIRRIVIIPCLGTGGPLAAPRSIHLDAWLGAEEALTFSRLPFDHPLYIVYSSGTTGLPKCIVHGAGGTLLQHIKELVLHTDLTRDDRIFYFTTCGWMMWNWLVSSLAVGAAVVLYDGAPLAPRGDILWEMAEAERLTVFGTSARYLAHCEKGGLAPGKERDLSALRTMLSTGSPLAAHSYDYVYRDIKPDLHLASISGGTDLLSCFALGNPIAPVWRGELQTRGLGMAVEIHDPAGHPVRGEPGELVCTRPFPSMPVAFWKDADGSRYRAAYFEHSPGVWRHGDWAELTSHDGLIIHGRSDATLNPGGVRIGTAEIYRQVEQLPEVVESLVVAQEWQEDVRVVLFVRLQDGLRLDRALEERIRREIRVHASPHHVPRKIIQVSDLPRTINGKLSELAVRAAIHGRPVANTDALANPASLELFRGLVELTK